MKKVVKWIIDNTISPPRCKYDLNNIVNVITDEKDRAYSRKQIEFLSNDIQLQCSLWTRHGSSPSKCVIYLHSAGMNQFEALNIVPYIINQNISLFAFDFPGCGLSGGKYLPFDGSGPLHVNNCFNYLRDKEGIEQFCIWGRSMGAAIALETVSQYPSNFTCVVSDSSFCSLDELFKYQVKRKGCPKFLVSSVLKYFKKEVKKCYKGNKQTKSEKKKTNEKKQLRLVGKNRIQNYDANDNNNLDNQNSEIKGLDINNNNSPDFNFPLSDLSKGEVPLLIGHGKQDTFIPPNHGQKLFNQYGSMNKQYYVFDAVHFKSRPYYWYENATRFIYKHMSIVDRPRFYEFVYGGSNLHIGEVEEIMCNLVVQPNNSNNEVNDDSADNNINNQNNLEVEDVFVVDDNDDGNNNANNLVELDDLDVSET